MIALVVAAAVACLALGWWQWTRFESSSGSFQNLGYALQWPLFAAFVVYAYRRVVGLEGGDHPGADGPSTPTAASVVTEVPADVLPARAARPAADPADDPVLTEYNAYLAQLDRDSRRPTP